jgi:chromosome segregation ATPase
MKSHASESETIECDIQQLQAKLDGVEHENTRLRSGIDELWKDEQELSSKHKWTKTELAWQEKELRKSEELLQMGFQHLKILEREFALHDRQILERLAELSEKSKQRQHQVTDVHDKIRDELGILQDFLEVIGAKHAKDDP